jgi:hypothetical protein
MMLSRSRSENAQEIANRIKAFQPNLYLIRQDPSCFKQLPGVD